jgi:hypothetical protein
VAKDKAHHDHARLISLDGRGTERCNALSQRMQGVVRIFLCAVHARGVLQREIEKLIAVCYCTARLIVRIHNIRVRALCENKLRLACGVMEKQCFRRAVWTSE